ncbi:hypothetical protein HOY80DRAFT_688505 [Tuber brumale]|nr:hypothetical protein HOY80DRAFT_688505 [Tuber brumale]
MRDMLAFFHPHPFPYLLLYLSFTVYCLPFVRCTPVTVLPFVPITVSCLPQTGPGLTLTAQPPLLPPSHLPLVCFPCSLPCHTPGIEGGEIEQ